MNFLNKPFRINKKIIFVKNKIEEYDTLSLSLGGGGFEEKVQCTRNLDAPFVKWIYKKLDAEAELKDLYVELGKSQDEVMALIDTLSNMDCKMVAIKKYIGFKSWSQISDELYSSVATVRRWHNKALHELFENEQG